MTKARTKAAKRRAKGRAGKISLAKSQPVERSTVPGRNSRAEDPRLVAARARCAAAGIPDTADGRTAALDPIYGSDMGRCIAAIVSDAKDRADRASTWNSICQARERYLSLIIGVVPRPASAIIPMLPDRVETNDHHTIDTRTEDERIEDARRAWQYWLQLMSELPPGQGDAVLREVWGSGPPLWNRDSKSPTPRGRFAVEAIKSIDTKRRS